MALPAARIVRRQAAKPASRAALTASKLSLTGALERSQVAPLRAGQSPAPARGAT